MSSVSSASAARPWSPSRRRIEVLRSRSRGPPHGLWVGLILQGPRDVVRVLDQHVLRVGGHGVAGAAFIGLEQLGGHLAGMATSRDERQGAVLRVGGALARGKESREAAHAGADDAARDGAKRARRGAKRSAGHAARQHACADLYRRRVADAREWISTGLRAHELAALQLVAATIGKRVDRIGTGCAACAAPALLPKADRRLRGPPPCPPSSWRHRFGIVRGQARSPLDHCRERHPSARFACTLDCARSRTSSERTLVPRVSIISP